jgi:hypothetical protein
VTIPENAEPVAFERFDNLQARGVYGDRERDRVVITDRAVFAEFWRVVASPTDAPVPIIDFSQRVVVAVSMGARASTGHHIAVTDVLRSRSTLYVVIEEVSPGPRCLIGAENTWPMTAVVISVAATHVEFVERERVRMC